MSFDEERPKKVFKKKKRINLDQKIARMNRKIAGYLRQIDRMRDKIDQHAKERARLMAVKAELD